eukprot:g5390.t1
MGGLLNGALHRLTKAEKEACEQHAKTYMDKTLEAFGIKMDDVYKLYSIFTRIDKNSSGAIDVDELILYFKLPPSEFANRVFNEMDVDGDNKIQFSEFWIGFWQFCTLTHDQRVKFAFDLYDLDGSGEIDKDEVRELVLVVFGKSKSDSNTETLMQKMDQDHNGTVELEEFRHMERKGNTLLGPCIKMQRTLALKLGDSYWKRQRALRRQWNSDNNGGNDDIDPITLHRGFYDIPEKDEIIQARKRRKEKQRRLSKKKNALDRHRDRHKRQSQVERHSAVASAGGGGGGGGKSNKKMSVDRGRVR